MKKSVLSLLFALISVTVAQADWLTRRVDTKVAVSVSADGRDVTMSNGLISRTFRIAPDVACTGYRNLTNGVELLRAVKPEARITVDGRQYNVGGLYGQTQNAYLLPEWIDRMQKGADGFHYISHKSAAAEPFVDVRMPYWAASKKAADGIVLSFLYGCKELPGVELRVHYAMYQGVPVMCKWLTITNGSSKPIKIGRVVNEILAVAEEQSAVVGATDRMATPASIYVETNYAFNNAMRYDLSDQTTHWLRDTTYTSQVNYDLNTPCLLEVYPERSPSVTLAAGDSFTSLRTFQLLMDSYDRERRALAVRRMYRAIAPWTTGNPIFMHLVSRNDQQVTTAIDQCAATGYEAVILSFGSHLKIELNTPENHAKWKHLADYAHSKGVAIGGYTLFSSRKIGPETDVIDPATGLPGGAFFGNAPCFGSRWGLDYHDAVIEFFENTGFDILEMDGPYPGDVCASTSHPGHEGLEDSQWRQIEIQKDIFHKLAAKGVYINAPDWYFLDGTNKIGLGYREVNFALPRPEQIILNRQNIYDGTWEKLASMGWGFVPLTAYHGGKADAVLEPLSEHLDEYRQLMFQYYGAGVQACYRGPRLYDTEQTRLMVAGVIEWYKKYRDILNCDVIHLRRPDGRDWDGIMHVSPEQKTRAMVLLYNPLNEPITRTINLPLYYTGLKSSARIAEQEGAPRKYALRGDCSTEFTFTLPAKGYSWFLVRE